MQLAYYYSLCAVNDEGPLGCHQGDFTHIDFLFLRAFFFTQLEGDMQWRAVGLSFPLRLQRASFGLANLIVTEIEHRFLVVALDRKDLFENSLESLIFPL